jgi:capsular exopolysaccharide synthesis family protein
MKLAFQGTIPEECPVIVRAILDSYRVFLDETYRGMSNETLRLIGEARDLLHNDLQRNEDAYIQFRQESPLVARGTDEVNPLQDRLAAIETRRTDLLLRRAEIEGQLKSLEAAAERGYDTNQITAFVTSLRNELSATGATSSPSALDGQLVALTDRERQLLEHFGPNHPHVVALRDRIEAVRQMQALPTGARGSQNDDGHWRADSQPSAIVDHYVAYLKHDLDWINTSENLLSELYQKEHGLAQELSGYQLRDERFRRTIDLTQELYEGVIGQLQQASLVKDFGGFDALVIADPELGEKVSPRGRIVVPLAGLLGGFVGMALAVVAEMRDKSFRSRREIQSLLGLRVFAEVPSVETSLSLHRADSESEDVSSLLWAHTEPDSPQSEAIRILRTTLLYNPSAAKRRVLQLTSPSLDDGMSVIAGNLAVSIAQLGHHVLLIDTNIYQPQQDQLFGVPRIPGLTSVVRLNEDMANAIHETKIKGLSILPAGTLEGDVSELFTSVRFAELMGKLREQFDYILVDTAPLLVRSDGCVIASQVDGVLLGFRPTKDSRERVERATEILATTGIQPIGAVVNGIGNTAAWGNQSNGKLLSL